MKHAGISFAYCRRDRSNLTFLPSVFSLGGKLELKVPEPYRLPQKKVMSTVFGDKAKERKSGTTFKN